MMFIIGLLFHLMSYEYQFGTFSNPGPGFFPRIVSIFLMLLGLITFIKDRNGFSK